jgi:hypothetical protein
MPTCQESEGDRHLKGEQPTRAVLAYGPGWAGSQWASRHSWLGHSEYTPSTRPRASQHQHRARPPRRGAQRAYMAGAVVSLELVFLELVFKGNTQNLWKKNTLDFCTKLLTWTLLIKSFIIKKRFKSFVGVFGL